jgi:hypothetical protein
LLGLIPVLDIEKLNVLESSLSWSEFWTAMACGAVALGLVIEYRAELRKAIREKNLKLLPLGALLVTLGVALEFGFEVRTSVLVSEVRDIQQRQASYSNERAANAEKEAARARLVLARMNAPRRLMPDQMQQFVAALRQHAGKHFWVVTQKSAAARFGEQIEFGKQISDAFTAAGWKKDPYSKRYASEKEMSEFADASDRGCLIEAAQRELLEFVSDRLRAADIDCELVEEPTLIPDFVFVEIGLR